MKLQSAFRNFSYVGAVQIVRMVLSLVIGIQVIRHLGPEAYGRLSLAMAIAMVLGMPASIAPNSLLVREIAHRASIDAASVISTALALRLAGAVVHMLLALGAIVVLGHGADIGIAVMLIATCSFAGAFGATTAPLELDGRFGTLAAISLASVLCGVVVRLLLLMADAGLVWFAAAMLIESVVMAALNLRAYTQSRLLLDPAALAGKLFDHRLAGTLLAESWPLALAALMSSLYTRTDVLCLTYFHGEHAAGVYSVAVRLTECWYFIPAIVSAVTYPALIKRRLEGPDGFYDLLTMTCGAGFWTAVALALAITTASPVVLPLLLGPAYDASIPTLQITAWSLIFIPFGFAASNWLLIEQMARVTLYVAFMTAVANVAANLVLVPPFGATGAAIGAVLCQAVACPLTLLIVGEKKATAALVRGMSPATLGRLLRLCIETGRGMRHA